MRQMEEVREELRAIGQEHVLSFWDELSAEQRQCLLHDLSAISGRLPGLPRLIETVLRAPPAAVNTDLLPAQPLLRQEIEADGPRCRRALPAAEALLHDGAIAALTVAGGQGTRLGFAGPKGAYPIEPGTGRSLFEIFAAELREAGEQAGRPLRWYLMVSPQNQDQTVAFFRDHGSFGLQPDHVRFFVQSQMPVLSPVGKMLLAGPHRLALAPDGHGGLIEALGRSGVLTEMEQLGIRHLSYFQVDNPLVRPIDPLFIGLHAMAGADMSCKAVRKAQALEPLGNFVRSGGKTRVIEYSDFPEALALQQKPDGTLRFLWGSISIFLLRVAFLRRLGELPWHVARKREGIKLERFLFDALPQGTPLLLSTEREDEFSPLKNLSGPDSVKTCQQALCRRAAHEAGKHDT